MQTSYLYCHAELVSASYQYGVRLELWTDPEINSG